MSMTLGHQVYDHDRQRLLTIRNVNDYSMQGRHRVDIATELEAPNNKLQVIEVNNITKRKDKMYKFILKYLNATDAWTRVMVDGTHR